MFPAVAEPRAAHPVFTDAFGERTRTTDARGAPLELLRLSATLCALPSIEPALRERLGRLAGFRHESVSRTRTIDVHPSRSLVIASDGVGGTRLSTLLAAAQAKSVPLAIAASRCLVRQLVHAVAAWHEELQGLAVGVIGPERIVITPAGRLVLVESVLGAVVEELRYSPERYWEDLRVAVPATAGNPSIDARSDVTQLGTVALALMLGRPLTTADYPGGIRRTLGEAAVRTEDDRLQVLPPPLYSWLLRALQLDPKDSFASPVEARDALDHALGDEHAEAEREALHTFLALCPVDEPRSSSQAAEEGAGQGAFAAGLDHFGADDESIPDLGPQIAAMRAFLARNRSSVQPAPASGPSPDVSKETAPESTDRDARSFVPSEVNSGARAVAVPEDWSRRLWVATAGALALGTLVILVAAGFSWQARSASTGSFSITTKPAGIPVVVDGVSRGATPLVLDLSGGEHLVELIAKQERRRIPVTIRAGGQISHYLELQDSPAPAFPVVEPAIRVLPAVAAPAPAKREPDTGGPNAGGWLTVAAPAEVQILENGRLLGTSQIERIMLPAGRHELEIVNGALGFRVRRSVQVTAGRVTSVGLEWPTGSLAVNAVPWAEVFIGERRMGETPIGNLRVPVGVHEVVFRHPTLGERRAFVTVTVGETARLAVDLRAK
jgi:hypothetical protein